MRRLLVAIVVITAAGLGLEARPGGGLQADALVKLLTPPMTAVARLVGNERWDSRLNDLIQRFEGAERLGSKWTSAAPAWQKARSGVGARLTALFDYYVSSGEMTNLIRARVDEYFPGSEAASLLTVLKSPAGPSIVHFAATTSFVGEAKEIRLDGPEVGSPEWFKETSALVRKFRERIPPEVPAEDKSQADAVNKFMGGPAGNEFSPSG